MLSVFRPVMIYRCEFHTSFKPNSLRALNTIQPAS
jgi:hypothetical protein